MGSNSTEQELTAPFHYSVGSGWLAMCQSAVMASTLCGLQRRIFPSFLFFPPDLPLGMHCSLLFRSLQPHSGVYDLWIACENLTVRPSADMQETANEPLKQF
jgi:hypothetical protein